MTNSKTPKTTLLILLAMLLAIGVQAQDKTKTIGNKPRSGSSNNSFEVVKGNQVGISMNAGKKEVQLLKLNFDVDNVKQDSLKFKVNVYEFNDQKAGQNLVKQDIVGAVPFGKKRIDVDLSTYNILAKGNLLVAIEWIKTSRDANPHFATGLFNGGTYYYEAGEWKKIPIAGIDFSVLVKKVK